MDYSENYNLKLPNGTDEFGDDADINDLNENFVVIDAELKKTADHIDNTDLHVTAEKQAAWDALRTIQTATGTGTAITLTGVEFEDGFVITFVIAIDNESLATTINGKSLYLPSTTTTPELTAGKAVTAWYDATNDCFYIQNGTFYLTATIPTTGWTTEAPYEIAITVTGLTDSKPNISPIYSETLATALLEKEAWNTVSYIDCTSNTMTVYCLEEIPETPINVELVGG